MGNTSRGIFIKTTDKWVLFLSFEKQKGPLTISLASPDKARYATLTRVEVNTMVSILPCCMRLHDVDIEINLLKAHVWQAPLLPKRALSPAKRIKKLNTFCREAMAFKAGTGLMVWLPYLLPETANTQPLLPADTPKLLSDILDSRKHLRDGSLSAAANCLINILGLGEGLTPSADDFIIGLLLSLNRWKEILFPGQDLRTFNQTIIAAAYQKTSRLSANLIECAAAGEADERLIQAIDDMMAGNHLAPAIIKNLVNWGNSSGGDVLAGMVIGITSTL